MASAVEVVVVVAAAVKPVLTLPAETVGKNWYVTIPIGPNTDPRLGNSCPKIFQLTCALTSSLPSDG